MAKVKRSASIASRRGATTKAAPGKGRRRPQVPAKLLPSKKQKGSHRPSESKVVKPKEAKVSQPARASGSRPAVKAAPKAAPKAVPKAAPKAVPRKALTPELAHIRARLQALLNERRQDIDQEVRGASERDLAHINDTSDMASDAADGDLALRIAESETVEASEIERAIEKIDNGTYGLCEMCNKPINAERMQFLPYVTQCIKCQALAEIRKREHGEELDDLAAETPELDAENN
ncbi:MAG: TraR/DksA C4-type zinc finger protein [Planctomycetota bacterium]